MSQLRHPLRCPDVPIGSFVRTRPRLIRVLVLTFLCLAVAAFVDGASLLLQVDRPIHDWIVAHRTHALNEFWVHVSFFGSTDFVVRATPVLVLAALVKSRTTAAVITFAALIRPVTEWSLKRLVGRHRPPQSLQLVRGHGPSFPCGHIMASAMLWCSVALVIALYVHSTKTVRVVNAVCAGIAVLIGLSRAYMGVHWPVDVVAGGIAATLLLALADRVRIAAEATAVKFRLARVIPAVPRSAGPDRVHVALDAIEDEVVDAALEPSLAVGAESRVH